VFEKQQLLWGDFKAPSLSLYTSNWLIADLRHVKSAPVDWDGTFPFDIEK
jgi:hypothetical protein